LYWIYDISTVAAVGVFATVFVGVCWLGTISLAHRLKTDAPENDIFYDETLPLHRVAATWVIEGLAFLKDLTSIE
jgi:hypothetical protein